MGLIQPDRFFFFVSGEGSLQLVNNLLQILIPTSDLYMCESKLKIVWNIYALPQLPIEFRLSGEGEGGNLGLLD